MFVQITFLIFSDIQATIAQPLLKGCGQMNSYLNRLKVYILKHQIDFNESNDFPCLDALWWHYAQCHSMSSEKAKQAFHDLSLLLSELNFQNSDKVLSLADSICAEQERIAFIAGLQLGAQLMLELSKEV